MNIPNLQGVIDKDDVFKKGAADYVSWARIANYLHQKAPGWQFSLRPTMDNSLVWQAPDGTGYLVGFFVGPDAVSTEDFPYAITDNRNFPIPYEKISARALCDSHRRAMCAAAAFFFSLGYELWAREEIAAAQADDSLPSQPEPASTNKPARAAAKPAPASKPQKPAPAPAAPAVPAASPDALNAIKKAILGLNPDQRSQLVEAFRLQYGTPEGVGIADHIKTQEHIDFLSQTIAHVTGTDS
jgi:hypothetical protein